MPDNAMRNHYLKIKGLKRAKVRGRALAVAALLLFAAWLDPLRDAVSEGNRLFGEGDYAGAEDRYRDARPYAPESKTPQLDFNEGDARYMRGEYDAALERFSNAARSGDGELKARSYFNMGNAYYKKGEIAKASDSYIAALGADPSFLPAKKNLEFLDREEEKKQSRNDGDRKEKNPGGREGKDDADGKGRGDEPHGKENAARGALDRDQTENIMRSMRDKPVRRERGKDSGGGQNDKPW